MACATANRCFDPVLSLFLTDTMGILYPSTVPRAQFRAINITDNNSPGFNYAIPFGSDEQQNLKCQYGDNFTVLP
jgi:hypothetical protein